MKNLFLLCKVHNNTEQPTLATILNELFGEGAYDKFMPALKNRNGKDLECVIANTGEWVPAKKYNELVLKEQGWIAEKDIYEKNKGNVDTLKKDFDAYKETSNKTLMKLRKEMPVISKLESLKVPKIKGSYSYLDGYINYDGITVSDNDIIGVDNVINSFITENPSFIPNVPNAPIIPAGQGSAFVGNANIGEAEQLQQAYTKSTNLAERLAISRTAQEKNIILKN